MVRRYVGHRRGSMRATVGRLSFLPSSARRRRSRRTRGSRTSLSLTTWESANGPFEMPGRNQLRGASKLKTVPQSTSRRRVSCTSRSAAMIVSIDRFAQPLDRELDVVRLQMAPAFDLGLVSILRVTLEVFRGERLAQPPARSEPAQTRSAAGHPTAAANRTAGRVECPLPAPPPIRWLRAPATQTPVAVSPPIQRRRRSTEVMISRRRFVM